MHDPMTVAFEIKNPLVWRKNSLDKTWRMAHFITIWHVDPESDGSDDSCGWSHPHLTKSQSSNIQLLAKWEADRPWFGKEKKKEPTSPSDAECLMRGAIVLVAREVRVKISTEKATRLAIELTHNSVDNLRDSLCFLPGYHTHSDDLHHGRTEVAGRLFWCLARVLIREARPWWRHPRWHLHHWKLQIHPLQAFKRWAWSRCCKCGKRFKWDESVTSNSWNSKGPQWFKGETDIYHDKCGGIGVAAAAPTEAT